MHRADNPGKMLWSLGLLPEEELRRPLKK